MPALLPRPAHRCQSSAEICSYPLCGPSTALLQMQTHTCPSGTGGSLHVAIPFGSSNLSLSCFEYLSFPYFRRLHCEYDQDMPRGDGTNCAGLCLQANAAAAEEAFTKKHGASGVHEGRAVWGPRPPPQHAALVRARLVIAAVGHADGRTLVADVSIFHPSPVATKGSILFLASCPTVCLPMTSSQAMYIV